MLGAVGHHEPGTFAAGSAVGRRRIVTTPPPTHAIIAARLDALVGVGVGALVPVGPLGPASVHGVGRDRTADDVLLPVAGARVVVRGWRTLILELKIFYHLCIFKNI